MAFYGGGDPTRWWYGNADRVNSDLYPPSADFSRERRTASQSSKAKDRDKAKDKAKAKQSSTVKDSASEGEEEEATAAKKATSDPKGKGKAPAVPTPTVAIDIPIRSGRQGQVAPTRGYPAAADTPIAGSVASTSVSTVSSSTQPSLPKMSGALRQIAPQDTQARVPGRSLLHPSDNYNFHVDPRTPGTFSPPTDPPYLSQPVTGILKSTTGPAVPNPPSTSTTDTTVPVPAIEVTQPTGTTTTSTTTPTTTRKIGFVEPDPTAAAAGYIPPPKPEGEETLYKKKARKNLEKRRKRELAEEDFAQEIQAQLDAEDREQQWAGSSSSARYGEYGGHYRSRREEREYGDDYDQFDKYGSGGGFGGDIA